MAQLEPKVPHPAIVARLEGGGSDERYLRLERDAVFWETDSARATCFPSLRDASRAAFRLPAAWRAFGLPISSEPAARAA